MGKVISLEDRMLSEFLDLLPNEDFNKVVKFSKLFLEQYSVCPLAVSAVCPTSRDVSKALCKMSDYINCNGFKERVLGMYEEFKAGRISKPSHLVKYLAAKTNNSELRT